MKIRFNKRNYFLFLDWKWKKLLNLNIIHEIAWKASKFRILWAKVVWVVLLLRIIRLIIQKQILVGILWMNRIEKKGFWRNERNVMLICWNTGKFHSNSLCLGTRISLRVLINYGIRSKKRLWVRKWLRKKKIWERNKRNLELFRNKLIKNLWKKKWKTL